MAQRAMLAAINKIQLKQTTYCCCIVIVSLAKQIPKNDEEEEAVSNYSSA